MESITTGYWRLSDKHKMFAEKAKQEKMELARLRGDMDLETHSYIEYWLNVRRRLHDLHEVALLFDEVKAWCLPFLGRGTKIEEVIHWVAREVKTVSDTVWQWNGNFAILAIEGVLSMLNGKGCQELGRLHGLTFSSDAAVV
jgi:hypothetical protein